MPREGAPGAFYVKNFFTHKDFLWKFSLNISEEGERVMSDILVHLPLGKHDEVKVGQKITFKGTPYIVLEVSKPKNEVGHYRDIKLICKKYGES